MINSCEAAVGKTNSDVTAFAFLHSKIFGLSAVRADILEAEISGTLAQEHSVASSNLSFLGPQIIETCITEHGDVAVTTVFSDEYDEFEDIDQPKLREAQLRLEHFSAKKLYELESARSTIKDLDSDQRDILDDYCFRMAPQRFKNILLKMARQGNAITWSKWLSEVATNDELMDFLWWHVESLASEQDSFETKAEIALEKIRYRKNVLKAVKKGWIHKDARLKLSSLDKLKVYKGDLFDTLIYNWAGYHVRNSDHIVIASDSSSGVIGNIRRYAKHEFNHAVLGFFSARWLNEALTEHIASSFSIGQENEMDPNQRMGDRLIYREERELLDVILNCGKKAIPTSLATLAYSSSLLNSVSRMRFKRAINNAWLDNNNVNNGSAINLISKHIAKLENIVQCENPSLSDREVQRQALILAKNDLLDRPDIIFNPNKKPYDQEQDLAVQFYSGADERT